MVRDRYPHLENRSVTKILGEWWANLEPQEKASYTDLAKQVSDFYLMCDCYCRIKLLRSVARGVCFFIVRVA